MSIAAKASRVFQSQNGSVAPVFMKSAPSRPAMLLKNSLPTALCFFCDSPAARRFSASAASLAALSSE